MESQEMLNRHEPPAVPEASEVTHADYEQAVIEQEQLEVQKSEAANMLDGFAREVADLDEQIAARHARLIELELMLGVNEDQDSTSLADEKKSLEETLGSLNDRYTRATNRFETSRAAYEEKFGVGSYDKRVIN